MALIDFGNIAFGRSEDLNESDYTRLMIERGEAILVGVPEPKKPEPEVLQAPAVEPDEGLSARRARVGSSESSQSPERRISLEDWAARLTGKRMRKA